MARQDVTPRGRRCDRRPRRAPAALLLLLTLAQLSAPAAAWAHGGEAVADLSPYARVARTVALAAAVLVAGAAVLRPLVGPATPAALRLVRTAAASAAVGAGVAIAGGVPAREVAAPAVLAAAASAAPGSVPAVLAGGATVVALSWEALGDGPRTAGLMLGHVAVAALWLGAVLATASAAPGDRLPLVRRLGPLAVGSAAALVLTGVLSARTEGVTLDSVLASSFGTVVLLKASLLGLAAAAGLAAYVRLAGRGRRAGRRGALPARAELALTVAAALAGATLTSLPPPGPVAAEGVPLARAVAFGDDRAGLLVVPHRPGLNLVHVMTDAPTEVVVAGRSYQARPRPDTEGLWAEVDLPPGHPRLELRQGPRVVQQVLATGPGPAQQLLGGADAAECASAALGALLGGSAAPLEECPHDTLRADDRSALRLLVTDLARRGARSVRVLADGSPRSRAAFETSKRDARRLGLEVRTSGQADAVVAVAGWSASHAAFADGPRLAPLHGVWLAPWLVHTSLVGATGTAPLAALPFDPLSAPARDYVAALRRFGPRQSATAAGLAAYAAASAAQLPPSVALFAATAGFHVMPTAGGAAGHAGGPGWFAGGSLTPVSAPLGPRRG